MNQFGAQTQQPLRSLGATGGEIRATVDQTRPIRLLVFATLYPNAAQPRHGVFTEERMRQLVASGRIEATVVAPVPWFPFENRCFGAYAKFARVPGREERHGIVVEHPRYPVIPKVGMSLAPALMYRALLPTLKRHAARGFDVLDAQYFYPDGVAAARLGRAVGKPVVISGLGNDLTLLPRYRSPRRQIQRAARHAAAIITVSQALKEQAAVWGIDAGKITVLRNAVDCERFRPMDRHAIRAELGLAGPVWLTVGHLIERKGVHLAIEALVQATRATLVVAGDGPENRRLRQLAARLGVNSRVRFLGAVGHDDLPRYYNAADALIHPASREGMPNVVLEALACGTPVVAAPFNSAGEVVATQCAGEIADERSAAALAAAWFRLIARRPDRVATHRFAQSFSWPSVVTAQCRLYAQVLAARKAGV